MSAFTSPYADTLGLTVARDGGRIVVTMASTDHTGGRPGFLHGGAISGLLDHAAWVTLRDALEPEVPIKTITIALDFLRGGKPVDSFAVARVVRLGRRIAHVTAVAWQEDEANPIASATLKFLIERSATPPSG